MSAQEHHEHEHGQMPTSGRALSGVALSATLHCLTGCAIGEVAGMIIGTAAGLSNFATIVISVGLAFLFGYTLTSLPLLRAGFTVVAVVPIALASDTFSIALMEVVDNAIMVVIPGALHAGLGDILFWGSLSFALAVAGAAAFPLNRWLIARGKGHTAVHNTGVHGGLPPRVVGAIAAAAFVFGTVVLAGDAIDGSDGGHGGGMAVQDAGHGDGSAHSPGTQPAAVRGLSASQDGLTLALDQTQMPSSGSGQLSFKVLDDQGKPVRDYQIEHEKPMHFIVARRDLTGFWHLHPRLSSAGVWSTQVSGLDPGAYRVFADFKHADSNLTLARDLTVEGAAETRPLPATGTTASTADGYEVKLTESGLRTGREAKLAFEITRDGKPVAVQPYLGASGHLVALRQKDLAFLHVHPVEAEGNAMGDHSAHGSGTGVEFMTSFPSAGIYRLFLQFKHQDRVHTAAFTLPYG